MLEEYPKEELQKIYEDLPEDLKEALFSEDAAQKISDICAQNGVEKENGLVSKLVGYALLGLLPPDEFEKTLAEELKLDNDVAKNVAKEIMASVFYPVKESLEALYKIKMEKPEKQIEKQTPRKTPTKIRGKDTYRESIE